MREARSYFAVSYSCLADYVWYQLSTHWPSNCSGGCSSVWSNDSAEKARHDSLVLPNELPWRVWILDSVHQLSLKPAPYEASLTECWLRCSDYLSYLRYL